MFSELLNQLNPINQSKSAWDEFLQAPCTMENGDIPWCDNDNDGIIEPISVEGYDKLDGTHVRGHTRADKSQLPNLSKFYQ